MAKVKQPWKTGDPEGSAGIKDPKYSDYAKKYPDLMKDYNKNWKKGGDLSAGGITLAEYGAMHFHGLGQDEGRTLGKKKEVEVEVVDPKKDDKKKDDKKKVVVKPTTTPYTAPTYTAPTKTTPKKYTPAVKPTTPPPEARPVYEGPAYDPNESIIPTSVTLQTVQDDEFVENRITDLLDTNNPMFRNATEARLRAMAGRGLGRNTSMAQEEVMRALFAVAGPIAEADARMLERHRALNNTAYFKQMNTRLLGVINKAVAHIAGGYQIQAETMKDITNRWKAQLAADLKEYGVDSEAALKEYEIDVGASVKQYGIDVAGAVSTYGSELAAATSIYATDVGYEKTKYVTDMQQMLGLQGVKINAATILSGIEDNAQATAYIWNLIFGENISPGDWLDKWKKMWEDEEET